MRSILGSDRIAARLCLSVGVPLLALSLMLAQPQHARADKNVAMPIAPPAPAFTPPPSVVPVTPPPSSTPNLLPADVTRNAIDLGQGGQSTGDRSGMWIAKNQSLPATGNPKTTGQGIVFHGQAGSRYTTSDDSGKGLPRGASLESGSILVSVRHPAQIAMVSIPALRGTICIGAGADAIVSLESGVLRVQNLDGRGESVRCKLDKEVPGENANAGVMGIAPGWELIAGSKLAEGDLQPDDGLARRPSRVIETGNLAICEVSLESVASKSPVLKGLSGIRSGPQEKNILRSLSKTAAVLGYTRGVQGFTAGRNEAVPKEVAMALRQGLKHSTEGGRVGQGGGGGGGGGLSEVHSPSVPAALRSHTDANGTVTIWYSDGSWEEREPNGRVTVHYPESSDMVMRQTDREGNTITTYRDGRTVYTYIDGTEVTRYPDGRPDLRTHPHGVNRVERTPDGVIIRYARNPDGTTADPEGRVQRVIFPPLENIRSRTTYADGRLVIVYADGRVVTTYPDGRVMTRHPDGRVVTTYRDGRVVTAHTDGRVVTQYRDGTTSTAIMGNNHDEVTTYSNSPVTVIRYDDGRVVTNYPGPGGFQVIRFPDGRVQVTHADGRIVTTYPDGRQVMTFPDRRPSITIYPDGRRVERWPNGDIYTTYPDGRHVITHPDGSTNTTYPDGHEVFTDASGRSSPVIHVGIPLSHPARDIVTEYSDRTVIRHPDGSVEIRYRDGRRVEVALDGTIKETYPDGRVVMRYPDGRSEQIAPPRH